MWSSFYVIHSHWNVVLNLFASKEEKEWYVTHLKGSKFSHERLCTNFSFILDSWWVQGYYFMIIAICKCTLCTKHKKHSYFGGIWRSCGSNANSFSKFSIWNDVSYRKAYDTGMVSINRLKFLDGRMPESVSRQPPGSVYNVQSTSYVHLMFHDERR